MARSQTQIAFVDERDDTPENREIVDVVDERSRAARARDRDLDELIRACGYEPAELLQD